MTSFQALNLECFVKVALIRISDPLFQRFHLRRSFILISGEFHISCPAEFDVR